MTAESLKITALTPEQAAKILAASYKRRIDAGQVREVAEQAGILRTDGTFSMIEYVAYLAGHALRSHGEGGEVTGGRED
ncbi:MAG: hypothetical protein R6V11_07720 [Ectothiorhodospiraceae bacterium]